MTATTQLVRAVGAQVRPARARSALLAAILTLVATQSCAISIRELRGLEASDKEHGALYAQYYLVGAMEGVVEANAHASRTGGKPTVCPNGRRIEPRMAKPLYDGELRRNDGLYEADMPVELVMRNALTAAYAC